MLNYLLLALIKILDNIILTAKSITTFKEQKILSSILVIISQLIFYLVISHVINDKTILSIVIVSVSSGIGNYIAFFINEKVRKPAKWTFVLTSSDKYDVRNLCNYLSANKVKHIANYGCNRKGEDTIHVIAFSKNKHESSLIENFIEDSNSKYLVEII